MGPDPENTAGGRDGPIERWSRTPGWGGRAQVHKTLLGAGKGPIEKWSRTPGWGGAGPGPEISAGTCPIEKWSRTPILYTAAWTGG